MCISPTIYIYIYIQFRFIRPNSILQAVLKHVVIQFAAVPFNLFYYQNLNRLSNNPIKLYFFVRILCQKSTLQEHCKCLGVCCG